MANGIKVICAVKGCGCLSMSRAMTLGFGEQDERDFRRVADYRRCDVVVLAPGKSERQFRCRHGEDRSAGCRMPPAPECYADRRGS